MNMNYDRTLKGMIVMRKEKDKNIDSKDIDLNEKTSSNSSKNKGIVKDSDKSNENVVSKSTKVNNERKSSKEESKKTKKESNEATSKNKATTKEKNSEVKKAPINPVIEIAEEAKEKLETAEKRGENLLVKEEINGEKLEKIKDEIKSSKKESKDKIKNATFRKKIQRNLLITILITIYFLFIDLGISTIPITVYMQDLKTFTIFIALIAVVIFESAYKKDENSLAVHGIEMVVVGIETLLLLQLYSAGYEHFNYVLLGITLGMIVYYLIKCIIIYVRYKKSGK